MIHGPDQITVPSTTALELNNRQNSFIDNENYSLFCIQTGLLVQQVIKDTDKNKFELLIEEDNGAYRVLNADIQSYLLAQEVDAIPGIPDPFTFDEQPINITPELNDSLGLLCLDVGVSPSDMVVWMAYVGSNIANALDADKKVLFLINGEYIQFGELDQI